MTAKELWKARALYIGHLVVSAVCYGALFLGGRKLGLVTYNHMSTGDWMLYFGYLAVGLVLVDLILNPLFKRKSRPWRNLFGVPPEDRWPRA